MTELRSRQVSQALSDRFGATYTDRFARILEIILSDEEMALLLAAPGRADGQLGHAGRHLQPLHVLLLAPPLRRDARDQDCHRREPVPARG